MLTNTHPTFFWNFLRALALVMLSMALAGCPSSSSTSTNTASSDATLSSLTLSGEDMDQAFQSSQISYTADANFLSHSTTVTPTTTDANATVTVNGQAVTSGSASQTIDLAEGANTITIAVTAEDGTTTDTYTVSVTRATAASFAQQAYLKASNAETFDQFGASVAMSGDSLVVGALAESSSAAGGEADNSASRAGAAYVFTRTNGVWSQQAYLKASNAETFDQFGASVAISGNSLVVGAPGESSSAAGGRGRQLGERCRSGLCVHPHEWCLDAAGVPEGQ